MAFPLEKRACWTREKRVQAVCAGKGMVCRAPTSSAPNTRNLGPCPRAPRHCSLDPTKPQALPGERGFRQNTGWEQASEPYMRTDREHRGSLNGHLYEREEPRLPDLSNSGGRGNSQRNQPRCAPLLPCPEPPGSSQASTGLQKAREKERAGVPSGSSARARAPGTHAADGPRCLKAAREDTAQADAQTGLPHPGHGGSELGSPGNPGFPSEASRPREGRVLKEPLLAEGWTVGIWENPSLRPEPKIQSEEGGPAGTESCVTLTKSFPFPGS
nr:uncharacterized protein LOC110568212 [Aotus nancymaae]